MPTGKDDLIAKMIHSRTQLDAALGRVTPQAEIYPSWKVKQLMDHITGWDELVAAAFQMHARGESPAVTVKHGIDQYNAASVSDRKGLTLEQSRLAYDVARAAIIEALREMPEDSLLQSFQAPWGGKCTVSSVVKIFVSHELEHAKRLEEILVDPSLKAWS